MQIATQSCVPHAIFGEGGLSRNGKVNAPKLGLLGYITKTFDVEGDLDILFIPVATNFDRVIEERTLVANAETDYRGRGARFVLASSSGFLLKQIWRKLTGNWPGFGTACANFGAPVSLREWSLKNEIDFSTLEKAQLFDVVQRLGEDLTDRVVEAMPVLPVPVLAHLLLSAEGPLEEAELARRALRLIEELRKAGAHFACAAGREDAAIADGLALLTQRGIVVKEDERSIAAAAHERPLLDYYANSVRQISAHIGTPLPTP